MLFHPKHSKLDQNLKVTPLRETSSIPITFIQESPPELLSAVCTSASMQSVCLLPCSAVCLTPFLFVCLWSPAAVTLLKREVCSLASLAKCLLREAKIWGGCIRRLLEGKTIPCYFYHTTNWMCLRLILYSVLSNLWAHKLYESELKCTSALPCHIY